MEVLEYGFNLDAVVKSVKHRYIICPDMECSGFFDRNLQCAVNDNILKFSPELKKCPHLDKAKLVVFCYNGHAIEEPVNASTWTRSECEVCGGCSFAKMSESTYRIPIESYSKFLKLPFNE